MTRALPMCSFTSSRRHCSRLAASRRDTATQRRGYMLFRTVTSASARVFRACAIRRANRTRCGIRAGCVSRCIANFSIRVCWRSISNRTFAGAGKRLRGVSLMTRSESSGTPSLAHARAMNSVSMSTAPAPDVAASLFRSSGESINAGTVKRFVM